MVTLTDIYNQFISYGVELKSDIFECDYSISTNNIIHGVCFKIHEKDKDIIIVSECNLDNVGRRTYVIGQSQKNKKQTITLKNKITNYDRV